MCWGPLFTGVAAPENGRRGADEVGIGVRRARHLPGADPIGVGLLRRRVPEEDEVRLGLEHEDRHPQVGADPQVRRTLGRR